MEKTAFLNGINLNENKWIQFYFKILFSVLQVPAGYMLPQTRCTYIK